MKVKPKSFSDRFVAWQKRLTGNPKQTALYAGLYLLVAIPIVFLLALLVHYSVNTPWWDQLSFIDLMTKLHNGQLRLYDLWAQHNEHRILVPQAVELISGKLTGFNFRVPVLLNFVVAFTSFGILMHLLRTSFSSRLTRAILAIPLAWLIFSPIQWVNWLWGFQLAFYMSVGFTIFTIWLLVQKRYAVNTWWLVLVLAVAGITTYCNGNGLLIWPIGLCILLWQRANRQQVIAWCTTGLVFIASYLYKFRRSPDSPKLSTLIKEPVAVIKYVLGYLGRNLALTPTTARWIGAVMVAAICIAAWYVYKRNRFSVIIAWLGIAAYALGTAALAASSRLNFGVDHGFISNSYPTISVMFIVSTLVVVVYALLLWVSDFRKTQLAAYLVTFSVFGALCALPLPAYATNYTKGLTDLRGLSSHLHNVQDCVYHASSPDDDCLLKLAPSKPDGWRYIKQLKALHWGDF